MRMRGFPLAQERPGWRRPDGRSRHWSNASLSACSSPLRVHCVRPSGGALNVSATPHRVQSFKFTTDPQAEAKIRDVVSLYLNPPTNAVVLSMDEKTQIQALEHTQPMLPLRANLPARQTHDYQRHGLISLYAALEWPPARCWGKRRPLDNLHAFDCRHRRCAGRAKRHGDGERYPSPR